jgi:hypothetical protein
MNQHLLGGVIIVTSICFFLDFDKWNSIWDVTWSVLGCLAVYCTAAFFEPEASRRKRDSLTTAGAAWGVAFMVCGLIAACRWCLPVHVSQLSPFLVIVAAFCMWKLWPDPQPVEKPEDLAASTDTHQGT